MDRRDFLMQTGTLLAGATLTPRSLALVDPLTNDAPLGGGQQGRLILPINRKWRYSPKVVEGGRSLQFDDSHFEQVVVPHTNIRLPRSGFDENLISSSLYIAVASICPRKPGGAASLSTLKV